MLKSGVYAITCVITGQTYVGSSVSVDHRIKNHLRKLLKGVHGNKLLQASFTKYGVSKFTVQVLEECSHSELLACERSWVEEFNSIETGFNVPQLGSNGTLTHGLTHSRVFKSWDSMLQRCTNPNAPDYPRYGGKGITVCDKWRSFDAFYSDMGDRPEGTTLDRYPNKNGSYEPGNCRWATPLEQQLNRNNTMYVTHGGVTKTLIEWADEKGMPRGLLRNRVHAGMVGNELFAPSYSRYKGDEEGVKRRRIETRSDLHRFEYEGKSVTIRELSELTGLPRDLLAQRLIRYKMPIEKALLNEPLKKGKVGPRDGRNILTAFGKSQNLTRWSEEYKISITTLKNRIYRAKMPIEEALTAPLYAQQRKKRI